jgi:PTS system nitrogen regulatory IIA component
MHQTALRGRFAWVREKPGTRFAIADKHLLLQDRNPARNHAFQGGDSKQRTEGAGYDPPLTSTTGLVDASRAVRGLERDSQLPMNRLAAILPATNVLVNVDATSKKRVFEHAGLLFENQHAIARGTVTDNLFARERLGSTGLGHAVAIPHGRIKGLKNPLAAVLRVQNPIPFDAPDDEAVSLLIFLLVPEAATQRHLEILSEIAEMLSDRELRQRLKDEPDAAGVHKLISDWQPLKSVA